MVASLYTGHGKTDVSSHKAPAAEGVSNCYVFKSQLQEYAQKAGLTTPVYETIKEGPSHEPYFRSTVIVNDLRYDSLPGFFNRKAAEQSAAEVALLALAKSGEVNECVSQPVHETGLCKNLLQEYAQKMNYAIPLYICKRNEAPSRSANYTCTVEIGGIRYIGTAATTKKEAEIKAARTALLAIQASSTSGFSGYNAGDCPLTVVPSRKRTTEVARNSHSAAKAPKAKNARFKKRTFKRKHPRVNRERCQEKNGNNLAVSTIDIAGPGFSLIETADVPVPDCQLPVGEEIKSSSNGKQAIDPHEREVHSQEAADATPMNGDSEHVGIRSSNGSNTDSTVLVTLQVSGGTDASARLTDVGNMPQIINDAALNQVEMAS